MAESENLVVGDSDTRGRPFSPMVSRDTASSQSGSPDTFSSMKLYFDEHFKSLKRELSEELQSSSSSTLKRFKDVSCSKDFKFISNQRQYAFNLEITEGLDDISASVKRGEQYKCLELADSLRKKVVHRNKLIRIADKSPAGWQTVKEYESDDLASDSEDDKKLKRAESRALSKQKPKYTKKAVPASSPGPSATPSFSPNGPNVSFGPQQNFPSLFRASSKPLKCYACGQLSHIRPNCPLQQPGAGFAFNSFPGSMGSAWQFGPQQHQQQSAAAALFPGKSEQTKPNSGGRQ